MTEEDIGQRLEGRKDILGSRLGLSSDLCWIRKVNRWAQPLDERFLIPGAVGGVER